MIETLNKNNFEAFKNYCRSYRNTVDDSYLYDEDLDEFEIGEENPTTLLYENNELIGVCSVIQDEYHLKGNKARIRILHSIGNRPDDYTKLLNSLFPLHADVKRLILFVPNMQTEIKESVELCGFIIERYSYVLVRENKEPASYEFPEGFELTDYVLFKDEEDYLHVRNTAFANLKGSETPQTKEQLIEYMRPGKILKGGAKILRFNGAPVGIIRMEHDIDEGKDYALVAPLAILPDFHGKKLGTNLLRAGIQVGYNNGFKDSMLSVNLENEKALNLYLKEGFEKKVEYTCYNLIV